jgi:hypothetical protein
MTHPMLRWGLAVLCAAFGAVVVTEIAVAAFSPDTRPAPDQKAPVRSELPPIPDIDAMVAAILERPLFTSNRLPFEESAAVDGGDENAQHQEPQQLQARLMGVAIRPEGREALFEREGSKPIAVKEGAQIDGWTVKKIGIDQVLLGNELGDEVVKPAYAPPRVRRPPQRVAATNGTTQTPNQASGVRSAPGSRQGQK